MRAIAMSLGQDANAEQEREKERQREEEERERKRQEEEEKRKKEEKLLRPLDKAVLDEFSEELLMGCMELVSSVAESVYRICDLVSALAKRNGPEWRNRTLGTIKLQVCDLVGQRVSTIFSRPAGILSHFSGHIKGTSYGDNQNLCWTFQCWLLDLRVLSLPSLFTNLAHQYMYVRTFPSMIISFCPCCIN